MSAAPARRIGDHSRLLVPIQGPGHTYTLDGRPLVGVTSVIHEVLRAPQLEEWFKRVGTEADAIRDEAAAFGSSIHAGLAAHARGDRLLQLDLPENWWATVAAGRQWIDDNLDEIFAVEEPIASARYGFAGMPDLYGRRVGRKSPVIIDYMTTRDLYWSHRFQTAAYRKAAVETYGDRPAERIVLLFSKDVPGTVTPHILTHHDADFAGFGYCLRLLAEKRQARAAERAEAKGVEAPPVMPIAPTVAPPAKTVATESGAKITYRKQTHFEVVDESAVPRQYWTLDEKKIGAAVRAGIATPENPIPGVRIWITEEPVVR